MPPRRSRSAARPAAGPPACDLEEVRPGYFLVHNPSLRGIIKSEGTIQGNRFTLTSWRREGMLARLAQRNFAARTLEDQIDALPAPPEAALPGASCSHLPASGERLSIFDPAALDWVTPPHHAPEQPHLALRDGHMLRRRQGRGPASYSQVACQPGGPAALLPCSETDALLCGYAQAALLPREPLPAPQENQHYRLPDIPLPPPYREVLGRFATYSRATGWQTDAAGWPLACRLYARLRLELRAA
jgi:hypothetical protein